MKEKILGLVEEVLIKGQSKEIKLKAKVDTGANLCSIDEKLAVALGTGPILETKTIRNANGKEVRPVVKLKINIKGREFQEKFTLSDREGLSYQVLIGQNLLREGFLVDARVGLPLNGEENFEEYSEENEESNNKNGDVKK